MADMQMCGIVRQTNQNGASGSSHTMNGGLRVDGVDVQACASSGDNRVHSVDNHGLRRCLRYQQRRTFRYPFSYGPH